MEKTATELVRLVRQWAGLPNQTPYRDGFAVDNVDGNGPWSILLEINEAQRELADTGYIKCNFSFQIIAGQSIYSADPWLHQYTTATYNGIPLDHTTLGKLDTEEPNWRNLPPGIPKKFYFISDQIGLVPAPATRDADGQFSLRFLADSMVSELANPMDRPKRLPARFHELLAIGAALSISTNDTENEAAQRRIPRLGAKWTKGYEDLKKVVQQRDMDQSDQIAPLEYRAFYR